MKDLWRIVLADAQTPRSDEVHLQTWICLRRVAGGLSRGQQQQAAAELLPEVFAKKGGKGDLNRSAEQIRILGAFELLDTSTKIKLGELLLQRLSKDALTKAEVWTLGRLGARSLQLGAISQVIPKETIGRWLEILFKAPPLGEEQLFFILGLWARKTAHRELNLPESLLEQVVARFPPSDQLERLKVLLFEDSSLSQAEQEQIYGEALPLGISLGYYP